MACDLAWSQIKWFVTWLATSTAWIDDLSLNFRVRLACDLPDWTLQNKTFSDIVIAVKKTTNVLAARTFVSQSKSIDLRYFQTDLLCLKCGVQYRLYVAYNTTYSTVSCRCLSLNYLYVFCWGVFWNSRTPIWKKLKCLLTLLSYY